MALATPMPIESPRMRETSGLRRRAKKKIAAGMRAPTSAKKRLYGNGKNFHGDT
jgi:hypothetical protein